MTSVLYACVCQQTHIRAESGAAPSKVTLKAFVDGTVSGPFANKEKASFNHDICSYNYVKSPSGYTFVAVAPKEVETRVVYDFLDQMMREFEQGSDKEQFQYKLNTLLARFQPTNRIQSTQMELDATKTTMQHNIHQMMEQGTQLEVLDAQVQNMEAVAVETKEKAHQVKKCARWKRLRMRIIICAIILVVIFIILVAVCGGFSFPKCGGDAKGTNIYISNPGNPPVALPPITPPPTDPVPVPGLPPIAPPPTPTTPTAPPTTPPTNPPTAAPV